MTMSINKLSGVDGPKEYYEPKFRRVLEIYMNYLRTHSATTPIALQPHEVYKHRGDFYGLVSTLGIRREHHWLIMRLNNIFNPNEVDQDLKYLLIPDLSVVDNIRQLYLQVKNK